MISSFYAKVLEYLWKDKDVDITQVKGIDCIDEKRDNDKTHTWLPITNGNKTIYVNTHNNSQTKFSVMVKCFEELQKKGTNIDGYVFEFDLNLESEWREQCSNESFS